MMKIDSPVFHIAVTFDQNYLNPIYALLSSIVKHNSAYKLYVHAIVSGISVQQKAKVRKYVESAGGTLTFYEINEEVVNKFVLSSKWTPASYYRLFFPSLISENIERLLYLDSDTIVINDLSELYTLNLDGYPLAAVYDNYVKVQPLLGINEPGEYFNSGMLLMDIKRWRQQEISERAINYMLSYPERIRFVDQCALNAVLSNNWKKIDSKYNLLYSYVPEALSKKELAHFLKNQLIIHFTLQRPWSMLCKSRLRYLYYDYLKLAPNEKDHRKYVDFAWSKIPAWIKIRLLEFYFDHPVIQLVWRGRKLFKK